MSRDIFIARDLQARQEAPDFGFAISGGRSGRLSDFRGKPVILDFWATWCAPCRKEIPIFIKAHELYGDKVTVIGMSCDYDIEELDDFAKKNGVGYVMGFIGPGELRRNVMALYGFSAIPSVWLIDAGGKVVSTKFRGQAILQAAEFASQLG